MLIFWILAQIKESDKIRTAALCSSSVVWQWNLSYIYHLLRGKCKIAIAFKRRRAMELFTFFSTSVAQRRHAKFHCNHWVEKWYFGLQYIFNDKSYWFKFGRDEKILKQCKSKVISIISFRTLWHIDDGLSILFELFSFACLLICKSHYSRINFTIAFGQAAKKPMKKKKTSTRCVRHLLRLNINVVCPWIKVELKNVPTYGSRCCCLDSHSIVLKKSHIFFTEFFVRLIMKCL